MDRLAYVDAAQLAHRVPPAAAAAALREALLSGLDPAVGPPRSAVEVAAGQLLLMPAEVTGPAAGAVGVKLVTVASDPAPGVPRIAGVYVLFGADLQPLAVVDGAALTTLRTPAVSAVAVDRLAPVEAAHLVVFGTGPQAEGHVQALREVRPLQSVAVVGRRPQQTAHLVARVRDSGLEARAGTADDVASADLVVCATTARTPLFDGDAVADSACVVAVGSHEPQARELPAGLLARAGVVVVEDVATALREAGDVVLAVAEGALDPASLVGLADLVRGGPPPTSGPTVFKSVGMAWEDLVVARAAAQP